MIGRISGSGHKHTRGGGRRRSKEGKRKGTGKNCAHSIALTLERLPTPLRERKKERERVNYSNFRANNNFFFFCFFRLQPY